MSHNYVDVIKYLAQKASDNLDLSLHFSAEEEVNSIRRDLENNVEDSIEKFAGLRCKSDLGGDELDVIELVMDLEEEFDVEISDYWMGTHQDDPTMGELAEHVVHLSK